MWSHSQLAAEIARTFDGDTEGSQLTSRQLKNLVSRQLVTPSDYRGGRRDTFYNERDATIAIIMVALVRAGLAAPMLKSCGQAWRRSAIGHLEDIPVALNGHAPPLALDAMIYDAHNNRNRRWDFQMIVRRKMSDGGHVIYADLVREGEPDPPETEPRSLAGPNADGTTGQDGILSPEGGIEWRPISPMKTLALIRIPATELVLDLLNFDR